jgi:gephyrin
MVPPPLKAAILVVSTTASKDPQTDSSGPTLKAVLEEESGSRWEVTEVKIVSDVVTHIQSQIMAWADVVDGINLVVTTGGTGFAQSDSTPEVRCSLPTRATF